jgi:hypothetical protein
MKNRLCTIYKRDRDWGLRLIVSKNGKICYLELKRSRKWWISYRTNKIAAKFISSSLNLYKSLFITKSENSLKSEDYRIIRRNLLTRFENQSSNGKYNKLSKETVLHTCKNKYLWICAFILKSNWDTKKWLRCILGK